MRKEFYAEYFELEDKHWWFVGRRRLLLKLLGRVFHPADSDAPREILDVGCGTGTMLQHLSAYGNTTGADADADAVYFCRRRGLENVLQLTDATLPFEPGTFDLVTMLDVLEHIDDDLGMLGEVFRVLKPDGLVLATVPAYRFLWGPQDEISLHKRRYRAKELKARLEHAGFSLLKLSYFNTLLFPFIAAIRLGRKIVPGETAELKSDFTLTKAGFLNQLLASIFAWERHLITRFDLPFGVSIVALARKKR
ncbi:MAG TPA: class I SAM-dependent methyltransferase [Chthoniobacterales bacterium]|nr:class I SAM-dependent methyltransferase [Chthoniobacterales bacterium]